MKRIVKLLASIALIGLFVSCVNPSTENRRERISLEGNWQIRLDTAGVGEAEKWYFTTFTDAMYLPGTTDEAKKGIYNTKRSETTHLSRDYFFVGKAWYKKEVTIPENWKGKEITLTLERTKPTRVWIDGLFAGENDNISTPQLYDLSELLTPGTHTLAIMVDNGTSVPQQVISSSHAYTESTQTNWNGIIGEMFIEAKEQLHIEDIQIYPNALTRKISVRIRIANPELIKEKAMVRMKASAWNSDKKHHAKATEYVLERGKEEYAFEYDLSEKALLWSEYNPALYKLDIEINGYDSQTVNFGLRDFKTKGTQFTINGDTTFLRGKHDACVFPLTAYSPMDTESWRRYFQICKEYGINHCRFHSWCPPKACFEAADIEGIYLQPELPFWGGLKESDERLTSFLLKEGINIQHEYGNHASFVLFALGNELSGDLHVMEQFTQTFRNTDNRHLYAFGSNNYLGFRGQLQGEDFLITCRVGGAEWPSFSTHTRGSFSFADAYDGGYLNNRYPNSEMNFENAIANCTVPVISHETGQFQVYPNYKEMKKYTGVLRPDNFEIFCQRLEKAGMLNQADDFFKASGRWAAMLYKADIEMDLRTEGFGGFQLLDLQDYPGQGSAYVGMLDAFMDSKGLITPEEWREFCNDMVPLFITEKFCWTNQEELSGEIKIANYSNLSPDGKMIRWELKNSRGNVINSGTIPITSKQKGLIDVGVMRSDLTAVQKAEKLLLTLAIEGTDYRNSYPLWVYLEKADVEPDNTIMITNELTISAINELKKGGKILWFPRKDKMEKLTVDGLFQTDYWNYRMFKSICDRIGKPASPGTLGILTNPDHPLFNDFPTDYHTNWQWFPIIKQSYPFILDRMSAEYKPIVQVIDNVERNHKLGLIFEFNIESGKLLVCMADLESVMDKPEARQLYASMLQYMKSDAFNPSTKMNAETLKELFSREIKEGEIVTLENVSY